MSTYQLPPINNPKIFEQLLVDMLNEYYQTISFKCFGKNGHRQKGIDVFSSVKKIAIQCKHKDLSKKAISIKKEVLQEIEKTLLQIEEGKTTIKFSELIIVSTASEHPDYDEYISELKDSNNLPFDIYFWGWENIQLRISQLPKTLKKYYPQFISQQPVIEDLLLSKLAMKKKIEKDFAVWLDFDPKDQEFNSKMIIHSVDDTHYPEHPNEDGPWFWFSAEIERLSTKGLCFINEITQIYVNDQNQWTGVHPKNMLGFREIKVAAVSVIEYTDIVDYNLNGDEYYNCPHFYVRFNELNNPFSEVYYKLLTEDINLPYYFDQSTELKANDTINS